MEELRFLVVKHHGAGEWLVKLPWSPWRFRAAQRERQDLLRGMVNDRSVGLFLIDPDDREYISDVVAIVERPSRESPQWLVVRAEHIGRAATDLHMGNWVLFLLDGMPDEPLPTPDSIDSSANLILGMVRDLGAYACVLSWEDDMEWTVVEPDHSGDWPDSV